MQKSTPLRMPMRMPMSMSYKSCSWAPRPKTVGKYREQKRCRCRSTFSSSRRYAWPIYLLVSQILISFIGNLKLREVDLVLEAGIGQTLAILKGVGSRFHVTNVTDLSASIGAYTIVLATTIVVAHRLGDMFGHKRIFILGLFWSAVWSLAVGVSFYSNRPHFVISRAFQGLGAGLTLPTGQKLLKAACPTCIHRGVSTTLYAAMPPIGLILGALGGSIFVRLTWWPWAYWSFSITLIMLGIASCFIIPRALHRGRLRVELRAAVVELDLPGMITGITCLGLFGFAWSQAHAVGWEEAYPLIVLITSVVFAVLFALIEVYYAPNPLIPSSALPCRAVLILVALASGWSCFGIWIFYSWQLVESLRSTSPLLVSYCGDGILSCFAN
ncbi:major facilitator superfamily-domain-containing protein [Xylaria palmicola]|nr:major facilitator superfamily-domain-containing protein [Xylaria palmicola]